jgi:sugar O-acyltransferase (sialic acid O-acetyltransferase NeuD family)
MILGIYGAGGLGREIYDIANRINNKNNRWSSIVFINDNITIRNIKLSSLEFSLQDFAQIKEDKQVIIAVGEPILRMKLYEKLFQFNIELTTLIDPSAIISNQAKISNGVIISEYTSIHADVIIEDNVLIQPFCCIGHDIYIGKHTVVSTTANIGGGAVIGSKVYLGMNCAIKQNINIHDGAIIGMGAVVYKNVDSEMTVIGNPARVTKGNENKSVFASQSK